MMTKDDYRWLLMTTDDYQWLAMTIKKTTEKTIEKTIEKTVEKSSHLYVLSSCIAWKWIFKLPWIAAMYLQKCMIPQERTKSIIYVYILY